MTPDRPRLTWRDVYAAPAMEAVLKSSSDAVAVMRAIRDREGTVVDFELVMVSSTAERLLDQLASDLVGRRLSQNLSDTPRAQFARYVHAVETGTSWTSRMHLPGLDNRWFDVCATGFSNEGLVTIFRDVTAECSRDEVLLGLHERQEVLEREALRDSLTGLGNRTLVTSRLEHAMSRLDRHATSVAVMFIDLDGLKGINDTYGHAAGDVMLTEIGQRLLAVTRAYDTVGRIGGDEFVVLCEDIDTSYDVYQIANRFLALCAAPVIVGEWRLSVAASVGIAVSGTGSTDAALLLNEADTAMYRAKSRGGDRLEFFDPILQSEMADRHDRESGLKQAIARNELDIRFDPVVGAADATVAFRAHAGWSHERHGFIDQQTVAAAAHDIGMAPALTDWVLDRSLAHASLRNAEMEGEPRVDCFVIVDVEGPVLIGEGFASRALDVLGRHRVDPRSLCIAIDGHYLTEHVDVVKPVLDEMAALGVRVARQGVMETGSAHTYLRELPLDIIILDVALTDELVATDTDLLGIVIDAAKVGHRSVMAGSSSDTQFETLTALGVDLIQRSQPTNAGSDGVTAPSVANTATTDESTDVVVAETSEVLMAACSGS